MRLFQIRPVIRIIEYQNADKWYLATEHAEDDRRSGNRSEPTADDAKIVSGFTTQVAILKTLGNLLASL